MITNEKAYDASTYHLFRALFQNPNVWLDSKALSEKTNVNRSSITTLLKRSIKFLKSEGLLEEKESSDGYRARMWKFIGQCEKPEEEARIWYAKMHEKKPAVRRVPQPPAPAALPSGKRVMVEIDPDTQEAIIRVALSQLGAVLRLIGR